jgi:outer membrane protein insertion porin family
MNTKFLKALFVILFFITTNAKSEVIKDIVIDGNKRVGDETIKVYGGIQINQDYSEDDINKILKNLYSTDFFEDVELSLKKNVLTINLKEFPVINQLVFIGEDSRRMISEIKKILKLKEKQSFIKSYLSKDIEIIKKIYSQEGYNSSEVETKIKTVSENKVDLLIEIKKGTQTKISTIKFIGDKKVRDRRLRDVIASEEDKFWKFLSKNTKFSEKLINLDIRLLANYYKSNGFYDVEINSNLAEINKDGNIDLVYSISAGERYTFKKFSINSDPVFDKELFLSMNKSYEEYVGEYYSPFAIKELLDDLDELIAKNNIQFVEHNVEETIDGNTVEVKFNVFESEKILVERINVTGNTSTNEDVIRGELLLDEGDPFSKVKLDKTVANIKSRNLFNDVKLDIKEGSSNDLRIINMDVEEKPTGEISAGAGVGTNGGTFAIKVSENNWLGKGNNINFEIEVDQESFGGTFNYTNPNYNFSGNSINYYISSVTNDKPDQGYENTLYQTGISTSFEQYKDFYANLGLSATYDDLRTVSTASDNLKKQSGSFSEVAGLYGFTYDKRNRSFMPTSGYVTSFNQSLPFYADKKFISNTLTNSNYKSFSENVVGAAKIYMTSINGLGDDDVRLNKRKFLPQSRLRGFQRNKVGPMDGDEHIGGNYAAALNFEANLPNLLPENTRTEVGLFLDFGNIWSVDYDSSVGDSNKIRSTTGVAASWISPLGPMTFTFSQDLSKAQTDKTEAFSFNLGTTF